MSFSHHGYNDTHTQGKLAEELMMIVSCLPKRDTLREQSKKATKKRAWAQKKTQQKEKEKSKSKDKEEKEKDTKMKRHRRSLSDSEAIVTDHPPSKKGDTPGRSQLSRLLSNSKKLLGSGSKPTKQHPAESSDAEGSGSGSPASELSRKFLKAKRRTSNSSFVPSPLNL